MPVTAQCRLRQVCTIGSVNAQASGSYTALPKSSSASGSTPCIRVANFIVICTNGAFVHACHMKSSKEDDLDAGLVAQDRKESSKSGKSSSDVISDKNNRKQAKKGKKRKRPGKRSNRRKDSLCDGVICFRFPTHVVALKPAEDDSYLVVLQSGDVWVCKLRDRIQGSARASDGDSTATAQPWVFCDVASDKGCSKLVHSRACAEAFYLKPSAESKEATVLCRSLLDPLTLYSIADGKKGDPMISRAVSTFVDSSAPRVTAVTELSNGIFMTGDVHGFLSLVFFHSSRKTSICSIFEPVQSIHLIEVEGKCTAVVVGALNKVCAIRLKLDVDSDGVVVPRVISKKDGEIQGPVGSSCVIKHISSANNSMVNSASILHESRGSIFWTHLPIGRWFDEEKPDSTSSQYQNTNGKVEVASELVCIRLALASHVKGVCSTCQLTYESTPTSDETASDLVCFLGVSFIDTRHRLYRIDRITISSKDVLASGLQINGTKQNSERMNVKALIRGLGVVKADHHRLLGFKRYLDEYLSGLSEAVQWLIKARSIGPEMISSPNVPYDSLSSLWCSHNANYMGPKQDCPIFCRAQLHPMLSGTSFASGVLAAQSGRYCFSLEMEGATRGSSAAGHVSCRAAFPATSHWRCLVTVMQKAADNSTHTFSYSLPLSAMMNKLSEENAAASVAASDIRAFEVPLSILASTEQIQIDISFVYPFLGGRGHSYEDYISSHKPSKGTRQKNDTTPSTPTTSSTSGPSCSSQGMCLQIGRFFFDMLDFSFPSPSQRSPQAPSSWKSARAFPRFEPGHAHTMDEAFTGALPPAGDTALTPQGHSGTGKITLLKDITWLVKSLQQCGQKEVSEDLDGSDAPVENSAGSQKKPKEISTSSLSVDEARILGTILGVPKKWRWERSSPGVVTAHGIIWGGHAVTISARVVQTNPGACSVQIQATCSDAVRLPGIRACLHQRLVTLSTLYNDWSAITPQLDTKRLGSPRKIPAAVDHSLRVVEAQLCSAKAHASKLLQDIDQLSGRARCDVDFLQVTKQIASLYQTVSNVYSSMRKHSID